MRVFVVPTKQGLQLLVLALMPAAVACGDKVCATLGGERIVPNDVTIAVGATTTLQFQSVSYCYGDKTPTDADYRPTVRGPWKAADTSVVFLDSLTGAVTGRAIGDTKAWVADIPGLTALVHVR